MSKIALTPNATGTGVFTISSPATNTNRTLTLPDEAGTVLTSASPVVLPKGVPAFRSEKASQSFTSSVWKNIACDVESFDATSDYDTSTFKFQPSIAGYYFANISMQATSVNTYAGVRLYKNGSSYRVMVGTYPSSCDSLSGSTTVYLNGSTDYIEAYGFWGAGQTAICVFEGFLAGAA